MRVSGAWNWIVSLRVLSNERTLYYVSRASRPTARELRIYPRIDNLSILARDLIVRTSFYGQKTRRRKVCWSPRTPWGWESQRVVHLQMRELISSHVVKILGCLGEFPLYPCLDCGGCCGQLWVLVGCRDVEMSPLPRVTKACELEVWAPRARSYSTSSKVSVWRPSKKWHFLPNYHVTTTQLVLKL